MSEGTLSSANSATLHVIVYEEAHPVGARLELFARLYNILNVRYEQVWGYGTPGFSAVTGIRLAL